MDKYTTTNYLESILFYTGATANQAAAETEQRNYGSYIEGLGYLDKTSNGETYWTNYKNVTLSDIRPNIDKLSDIFVSANTYATANYDEYPIGEPSISSNRFNIMYSYEGDLENAFSNALPSASADIKILFSAMNEQIYNQKKYYGDEVEINSIRIGAVTFYWRPENYVAYTYSYTSVEEVWTYVWEQAEITEETYNTAIAGTIPENTYYTSVVDGDNTLYYVTAVDMDNSEMEEVQINHSIPYVLEGNDYYAYVKSEYVKMDGDKNYIAEAIKKNLDAFEERHGRNQDMYAYYMYDCTGDIKVTFDSNHVGVKESTIPVRFTSNFDHWFTYNISIPADAEAGDIVGITSATDGAIFSVRKNENTVICGDNVALDEGESHTFTSTSAIVNDDEHDETISILTPWDIDTLDLSYLQEAFNGELNLNASKWVDVKGCKMKTLLIGTGAEERIEGLTKITGLNEITSLENIDLTRCGNLRTTPAINRLANLHTFKAKHAAITTFIPADGVTLNNVELNSEAIKLLKLVNATIDGTFDYEPTTALKSLTLDNVTGLDTYQFVNDWYTVLNANNAVDSVIYLSLKGINWNNVPVSFMKNLRKFDINEISGTINIVGSGEDGLLTRDEYNDILRLYGINAFNTSAQTDRFKIYPELILTCATNGQYRCEEFEFSLSVENITEYTNSPYDTMPTTLNVTIENNVAGNAFLDLLPKDKFTFIWDSIEKYAYCQLDNAIDTSNSEKPTRINAGDIMLYNGDTILIFGENIANPMYEYVKIGSLTDERFGAMNYSAVLYWFNSGSTDLHFIEAERPEPTTTEEPTTTSTETPSNEEQTDEP